MRNPDKGDHGVCPVCGYALQPEMFTEEETRVDPYTHALHKTGRVRRACNYLFCPNCGKKEAVDDDYFAEPWRYKK